MSLILPGGMEMKIRFSLVALLLGTLAALSLKIYQIYDRTINLTTCFTKEGSVIAIMLPVVMGVAIVAMMVVAFLSPEYPKFSPNHRSVPLGIVCIAISFVLSYTMSMDFVKTDGREFEGTPGMVCSILGLLSVVSFFFLAVGFFRADNMIESTPLVLVFPISWMGVRLTLSFFNATSAANITENSYDILAMAFLLVFLLTVGKFMSGAAALSAKWAFAVGCPASMLAFLSTVPRYFIKFMAQQQPEYYGKITIDKSFEPHLVDLLLAIFAFMFLFHISKRTVTKAEIEQQASPSSYNKSMAAKFGAAAGSGAAFGTTAYGSNAYDANKYGVAARQPQMRDPNAAKASQFAALRARAGQAPQRAMYGSGADQYTTKGAGMKVADSFSLRPAYSKGSNQRYGGLGDFRNQMTGGRRAMDVLETSNSKKNIGFKPLNIDIGPSPEEEEAAKKATEEQKKELGDLNGVVATSLAGLFGAVKGEPKEVSMEASPDEESSVTDNLPEIEAGEADERAKAVVLGTGLADKLAEKKEPSVKYGRRATDSIDPDAQVKYGRRATDSVDPDNPSMSMYGRRATDAPMYDEPYGGRPGEGYGAPYEDDRYDGRYGGRGYDDYDQGEYDYRYADEDEEYDEDYDEEYDEYEDEEYDGYDDENYYDDDEDEYYDDDEYDDEYDEDEYYDEDDEDYYDE